MSFQLPTCSRHQGSLAILQQISRGNLHVCKGIFTSGRSYQCCSRLLSRRCALRQGSLGARHKPGRQRLDVSATSLRIAFVSAEVAPWSRTGGLGDVVGALPIELARRGHKVMTIAPRYDQHADLWDTSKTQTIDGEEVRYFHTIQDGVDRVFVDHPWFLAKV